jgi:flagellar motor switch protein FliG
MIIGFVFRKTLSAIMMFAALANSLNAVAAPTNTKTPAVSKTPDSGNANLLSVLDLKIQGAEKELEERARRLLSSQLDTPYSLYVKIDVDQERFSEKLKSFSYNNRLRTLPSDAKSNASRYVRTLSVEDVFSLIKAVKVSLSVDKSISEGQVANVSKSISAALSLKPSRGDSVEIEKFDLASASLRSKQDAFNREQQSVSFQNKKLEMMLKEMELQNKALQAKGSEKNPAGELTLELKKISDEIKEIRQNAQSQKIPEVTYEGPLAPIKKVLVGLELPVTLLLLGLLLTLVMLKVAGGQGKTAIALKGGLEELGKSVQAMADTLAGAAKSASEANVSANQQTSAETKESRHVSETTGSESGSLEILQADAMKTWQLLSGMPYFLLSVLKDWLADPESRERFLQVTEAVGAENASWIWSKFPSEEIEQLGTLLSKPISKATSFTSVSTLYRAAVREAGTKALYAKEIADLEFLISLTDNDLVAALAKSDDTTVAAVLAFLTPLRATRVMNSMGERLTVQVLGLLVNIQSEKSATVQKVISQFRTLSEKNTNRSGTATLLTCLVRILEVQGSGAQKIAKMFLAENTQMAIEVRKRVLTFDDIMQLDSESLYDLMGALTPLDAAVVLATLNDIHRQTILGFYGGKAKVQIDEELKRIESKKKFKRQAELQAERIKATLVRKARTMRDQGLIEFASGSAPEAAASNPAHIRKAS